MLGAAPVRRDDLAVTTLSALEAWLERIEAGESPVPTWRTRLLTLGRRVVAESGSTRTSGRAVDVDPFGNLRIETDEGEIVTVTAGDVTLASYGAPQS
jgi:BirA family biotin operon repressor/biotin-[acetyl-CoA-carboxylase] ligase